MNHKRALKSIVVPNIHYGYWEAYRGLKVSPPLIQIIICPVTFPDNAYTSLRRLQQKEISRAVRWGFSGHPVFLIN
jgi:hypothetical protein